MKEGDFLFNREDGTIGARSPGVPAGLIDPIAQYETTQLGHSLIPPAVAEGRGGPAGVIRPFEAEGLPAERWPEIGEAIEALCGKKWVPTRDPDRYPVCPVCKEAIGRINSAGSN